MKLPVLAKVVIPLVLFLAGILCAYIVLGVAFAVFLSMIVIELVSPFSMEVAVPFGMAGGLGVIGVVFAELFINFVIGLFATWNFDLLKSLPFLSKFIIRTEKFSRKALAQKKWISRLAAVGLLAYFIVPFQGTGAVVTSIIGRLLSFSPLKIMCIIIAGSLIASSIISLAVAGIIVIF